MYPDIWTLIRNIVNLIKAAVEYYFYLGTWDDVLVQWNLILLWFTDLFNVVDQRIIAFWQDTINGIHYWIDTFKSQLDQLSPYINLISAFFTDVYDWLYSFFLYPYQTIVSYLDATWDWLVWFYNDPLGAIEHYLGIAWAGLVSFYTDAVAWLDTKLGGALTWLAWFFGDPVAALNYYLAGMFPFLQSLLGDAYNWITGLLGSTWDWLIWFYGNTRGVILGYLGNTWDWLVSLYSTGPARIFAFLRDTVDFYYYIWADYRESLLRLLDNPTEYLLGGLRDGFLAWLEQLLVDNW